MLMTSPDDSAQATLRRLVLDALEHFWWPLSPKDELEPYLRVLYGRTVTHGELDDLLNSEREAFARGVEHDVWLCLGLRPDQSADLNRWARSDWPMWVRIVDPDSEQIRSFWLLRQLYRAPVIPSAPGTEPLAALWSRLAAQLPAKEVEDLRRAVERDQGQQFDWTEDRYAIWAESADGLFDRMASTDRQRRQEIANRLASLDAKAQLFGVEGPTTRNSP